MAWLFLVRQAYRFPDKHFKILINVRDKNFQKKKGRTSAAFSFGRPVSDALQGLASIWVLLLLPQKMTQPQTLVCWCLLSFSCRVHLTLKALFSRW